MQIQKRKLKSKKTCKITGLFEVLSVLVMIILVLGGFS